MATLGRLKRGSVQIQRAAIKATGRIGARTIMTALVVWALVLQGLIQHSPSVALLALSEPALSSEEFAEYVANTSYVTRYCRPGNASDAADDGDPPGPAVATPPDAPGVLEEVSYEGSATTPAANDSDLLLAYDEALPLNTTRTPRHRHGLAEPFLKVPLSSGERAEAALREAFLWGALAAPLPAARLAARAGAARVAGGAGLAAGALVALVPFAWAAAATAAAHPYHYALRVAQGACAGAMWPALHMLGTSWYPPLQRTGYVSCYSTVALGQALAGLAGAPLVRVAGREALCYVLACLSLLWFLAWLRLVRDAPAHHPRVSEEQRAHLHAAIGPAVAQPGEVAPLPWKHVLLSVPVWACAVANLGGQWGQATLQQAVTKYLKLVYGFALTYDHVLGVLPPVGQCMAGLFLGQLADRARGSALVSSTTARKLLVYTSHFPAGAMLFVVGYSGCDPTAPAALYTAAVVISGATAPGVHASAIDVAPNYAGTVFGLSQTLGAAGGLAGSYVVTEALHGSLPGSWRLLFGVAALVLGLTAMFFLGFGSGSVQPWNGGAPPPALAPEDPSLALGDLAAPAAGPAPTDPEAGPSAPPAPDDARPAGEEGAAPAATPDEAADASPAQQASGTETPGQSHDIPVSDHSTATLRTEAGTASESETKTLTDSNTQLAETTQGECEEPAASNVNKSEKTLKSDISTTSSTHPKDQISIREPTPSPKNTMQSHVSTSENAPGD